MLNVRKYFCFFFPVDIFQF